LFVFKHDSELGNAPAHVLFDLISASKKADVVVPRSFTDYQIVLDETKVPRGVTLIKMQ